MGYTTTQADEAVEAILTTLKQTFQQGELVILRRFGTWQVRAKRARGVQPEDRDCGCNSSPAGRPLCREPDAEAGCGSGGQPRGLSQHANALREPGAPWWQRGGHQC